MPRKKKEVVAVLDKPKKEKKSRSETLEVHPKPKYFVDGHSDVREYYEPIKQYEIDWNKIAADVRAAAEMVKNYEQDNGPLTKSQIKQIKETALKPKQSTRSKKAT